MDESMKRAKTKYNVSQLLRMMREDGEEMVHATAVLMSEIETIAEQESPHKPFEMAIIKRAERMIVQSSVMSRGIYDALFQQLRDNGTVLITALMLVERVLKSVPMELVDAYEQYAEDKLQKYL